MLNKKGIKGNSLFKNLGRTTSPTRAEKLPEQPQPKTGTSLFRLAL